MIIHTYIHTDHIHTHIYIFKKNCRKRKSIFFYHIDSFCNQRRRNISILLHFACRKFIEKIVKFNTKWYKIYLANLYYFITKKMCSQSLSILRQVDD